MVVYSGGAPDREIIREHEFKYDCDNARSERVKFNVLLISFEMLLKDFNKLKVGAGRMCGV